MRRVVSATEARIHFGELMREVVRTEEPVMVERGGKPHVVLLSIAQYERLKAAQARDTWREGLEQAIEVGARIKSRRGGWPLTGPEEIVHQTRGEPDAAFSDLR